MPLSHEEAKRRQREARRKSNYTTYHTDRDAALDAYGGKCKDCGTLDRTTLMVLREFGAHWGKYLANKPIKSGAAKFRWLRQNGYPEGFILLCRDCKPQHHFGSPSHASANS